MDYKDYYAVLGVPRTASQATSRRPSASSPGSTIPIRTPGRRGRAAVQGGQRGQRRPVRPGQAQLYDRLGRTGRPTPARARPPAQRRRARAVRAARSVGSRAAVRRQRSLRVPHDRRRGDFSDFFQAFFAGASEPVAPAPGAAVGRPAARRSRTSSPGWVSIRKAASAPAARSPRRQTDRRSSPPQRRGRRRDHARRGIPRHDPPGRGRRQASRGHDPEGRRQR